MKDNQLTQAELQFLTSLLSSVINDQKGYADGVKYKIQYFFKVMEENDWEHPTAFKHWSDMKKLYKDSKKSSNKMSEIQRKLKRQMGNP